MTVRLAQGAACFETVKKSRFVMASGLMAALAFALGACSDPAAERKQQIAMGLALVTTYCADCHATGASGDSPLETAPPFRELHNRYDVALLAEALVEGLVTAHPAMPEFEFDPDQAEAIIVYLESLEGTQPSASTQ